MNRRTFLKTLAVLTAGAGVFGLDNAWQLADKAAAGALNAQKLGWRLGCQAWTFWDHKRFTFFEAIDKTSELGLHYIEAFPDQPLSPDQRRAKWDRSCLLKPAWKSRNVSPTRALKLVNFGVGPYNREAFEFAKDMGIENARLGTSLRRLRWDRQAM